MIDRCHETVNENEAIRSQAERWFARLLEPGCPPALRADFEQWRSTSAAHRQAYAATERMWQELHGLAADADILAIRDAAPTAAPRHARSPIRWKPALLAATLAVLTLAGVLRAVLPLPDASYVTAVGEQRTQTLADGSRVTLNTDSRLDVRYTESGRRIVLHRGEALFDVQHDTQRPFVVAAARGTVTALGTRFQVRRDGDRVAVALIEGSVRVEESGLATPRILQPGEQARYEPGGGIAVQAADLEALTSWTRGRLVFHGVPLAEMLVEVNRYSARKIRLHDAALAAAPVSGTFRAGDSAAVAAGLEAMLPVRSEQDGGQIVLYSRR